MCIEFELNSMTNTEKSSFRKMITGNKAAKEEGNMDR
jgi:hypothetical protein